MSSKITVSELAKLLDGEKVQGGEQPVTGVVSSGKHQSPGSVFVAVPGVKFDGHQFIGDAVKSGAVAVVVQNPAALGDYPGFVVSDARVALSKLAAIFAGEPSLKQKVVGITGTSGKTTTNWMVHHLLLAMGQLSMRIGTLGISGPRIGDLPGDLTTPDPISLQQIMGQGLENGIDHVIMETSSHSLHQCRVRDVAFDVGVFTNLSRDHLDYHPTMEDYFKAKQILFESIISGQKGGKAVICTDDEWGRKLAAELRGRLPIITVGRDRSAELRIDDIALELDGSTVTLAHHGNIKSVTYRYVGLANAQNLVCAIGALIGLGYSFEKSCSAVSELPPVPGRLESCGANGIGVYVDYAHKPDALEKALGIVREVTKGQVIVLFGCGGDRDRGKRPVMAEIARRLADKVIVTSDNPRTENPDAIIKEILTGAKADIVESDRRKAIQLALRAAKPGDVVLIAGKGHEDYQIIGTTKHHFSDLEEVQNYFKDSACSTI
jgi:UDP-N-acetylmuramoyl-L-alanyl-D-glutamate--2,6-diaminopimelate ligase